MSPFASELLEHLNSSRWKTSEELIDEIGNARRAKRKKVFFLIPLFNKPDLREMYATLNTLRERGFATSRERQISKETLAARKGVQQTEWALTEQGRQARIEKGAENQSESGLSPVRA